MSNPLTPERLTEIERRANAATPGPITFDGTDAMGYDLTSTTAGDLQGLRGDFARREDAEFYAAAREDIPDLLAEVRRLREQGEKWRNFWLKAVWRRVRRPR